jgi:uncharacterized protein (DUF302 family)
MSLVVSTASGTVAMTVAALRAELDRRGIGVFGTVDHGANARTVGLALADEVVVIFGDPAVGTHLMAADPQVGIELPLRLLVWDDGGTTRVAYDDPRALAADYALASQADVLERMAGLLAALVATVATD